MRKKKNEEGKKDNKNGKKTKKFSLVKVILIAIAIVMLYLIGAFGFSMYVDSYIKDEYSDNKFWMQVLGDQSIWSFSETSKLNIEFPEDGLKNNHEVKYFDSFTDFKNSTKISLSENEVIERLKSEADYKNLKDIDIREEKLAFATITKNRDNDNIIVYRFGKQDLFYLIVNERGISSTGYLIPLANTKLYGTYRAKNIYGFKDSEELEKARRELDNLPSFDISNDTIKAEGKYSYFASYSSVIKIGNSESYKTKDRISELLKSRGYELKDKEKIYVTINFSESKLKFWVPVENGKKIFSGVLRDDRERDYNDMVMELEKIELKE